MDTLARPADDRSVSLPPNPKLQELFKSFNLELPPESAFPLSFTLDEAFGFSEPDLFEKRKNGNSEDESDEEDT